MDKALNTIIIVTGQSGAGLSTALKCLEDMGYEAFDNFPLDQIETLLAGETSGSAKLAFGVDSRTRHFSAAELETLLSHFTKTGEWQASLIYLSCNAQVLQNRFSETRRKHPMAKDKTVGEGIRLEAEMLAPIAHFADIMVDTSTLSIHDLRHRLEQELEAAGQSVAHMAITFMSFGFKNGAPDNADIVIDVRFLKNPHWDENLKPLTGQNDKVGAYIEKDANFAPFFNKFTDMVDFLIPAYEAEGKSYLTIAIGCTGGKHRSVYMAESLKSFFEKKGLSPSVKHRDL